MSGLLDELGLDAEDFGWQDLGICRNLKVGSAEEDIFFDRYESDEESAKAADQICLRCPVIQQCFMEGSKGNWGLWGGIYWNGAGKPDKNRNSHKTEEVWSKLHKRVAE